ncbi:MAG: PAS domain-containing protein [Candidatus Accumulibacter sp.]|jgi:two-component system sensor histidine kinase FlrB|nr:PAS domain-containing protein [Accumulibacter sp.]
MDKVTQIVPPDPKARELQLAFDLFNQRSRELTLAYETLQARAESLTKQLAIANGELRRQYEEKEALSERLASLLNALPAGVVVLANDGTVSEANPAARKMLGDTLIGNTWPSVRSTLEPTETPEEWLLGKLRVSIAESPLDSSGGNLLLIHDMTAAHELKAGMERKQRLAAMGEMAASLAHQLRTPLAAALLYSANLSRPGLSEAARARFSGKATEQLKRLERLIQDVLLFARGESIGRERIPVFDLLAEMARTVEPLCREKGVAFSFHAPADRTIITGSRKALGGALLNLLENALQACEENDKRAGEVSLSARIDRRRVKIIVNDTGIGVSAQIKARIFEPFFTTRNQGTGLGLAIALGVVRAHAGTIDVHSTPGKGTRFVVWLPCANKEKKDETAGAPALDEVDEKRAREGNGEK